MLATLGYQVTRQQGSHRTLKAPSRPVIIFSVHPSKTVGPTLVRDILVKQAGLTLEEAEEVARNA